MQILEMGDPMNDVVIDYAELHLGERAAVFIEAQQFLLEHQFEDHVPAIEQIISLSDNFDAVETEKRIEATLSHTLEGIARDHGVLPDATIELSMITLIVRTLYQIEDTDQLEYYLGLLEDRGEPTATFSELVGEYWDRDPTEIEQALYSVDAALLDRIQSVLVEELDRRSLREEAPRTFRRFYRFLHEEKSPCMQYLVKEDSYEPGYAFDHYWRGILERGEQGITCGSVPDEYLAAALATGEDDDTILECIEDRLSAYTKDGMELAQYAQYIRNTLNSLIVEPDNA
jgi:hypothetical protein